jgi:hypothetical protein
MLTKGRTEISLAIIEAYLHSRRYISGKREFVLQKITGDDTYFTPSSFQTASQCFEVSPSCTKKQDQKTLWT